METTIENRIADMQQRISAFREQEPTEKQLHAYTDDYLSIRRTLDQLEADLKKNHEDFSVFYNEWLERHEPSGFMAKIKSCQLDMFMDA